MEDLEGKNMQLRFEGGSISKFPAPQEISTVPQQSPSEATRQRQHSAEVCECCQTSKCERRGARRWGPGFWPHRGTSKKAICDKPLTATAPNGDCSGLQMSSAILTSFCAGGTSGESTSEGRAALVGRARCPNVRGKGMARVHRSCCRAGHEPVGEPRNPWAASQLLPFPGHHSGAARDGSSQAFEGVQPTPDLNPGLLQGGQFRSHSVTWMSK